MISVLLASPSYQVWAQMSTGIRTSRSKAAGRCWSRCTPRSSTSSEASCGQSRRDFLCCSIPASTSASRQNETRGSTWTWAFEASSAAVKSPGRDSHRRESGRSQLLPLAPRMETETIPRHLVSSSSPCWHLARRTSEYRAAFLSQTKKNDVSSC